VSFDNTWKQTLIASNKVAHWTRKWT